MSTQLGLPGIAAEVAARKERGIIASTEPHPRRHSSGIVWTDKTPKKSFREERRIRNDFSRPLWPPSESIRSRSKS